MKSEIVKPNYENSILNLITSILKYYHVETKYKSLEKLDTFLNKKYDNIVLLVFDGMGKQVIKDTVPEGILAQNIKDTITSIYPSTTTAAMTTYYSGRPPIETGWIACAQYFKEYGRVMNLFKRADAYTNEKLEIEKLKIKDIIGYETIYEKIKKVNPEVSVYEIMPEDCDKKAPITILANEIQNVGNVIVDLCHKEESKFILAYHENPDSILHKFGCKSKEAKSFMLEAEKELASMLEKLKGTNTLVICSADHGHKDIGETVSILEDSQIQDCLIMPPSFESRMVNFFVKADKHKEFEEKFKEKFQDSFVLYSKKQLLESHLLGYGEPHKKVNDFIGDYVAVAISDTRILLENYLSKEKKKPDEKKSTHCGLTKEEMEVPLIIFEVK